MTPPTNKRSLGRLRHLLGAVMTAPYEFINNLTYI